MATGRRHVRFAALGDSVTHGLGDRASGDCRGWARILSEAIAQDHDVSLYNLAFPGATAADVRATQLAEALEHRPDLASLIIGLNDTLRSTWDPAKVRADLLHTAGLLGAQGAMLLTVRFHDHTRVFGLPRLLAHSMGARIDVLNAIYDEIHATYGGLQVDLSAHPGVYDPRFWSLDRLHPSELGHRALAHEFSALLEQHGLAFQPPALELDGDPTSRLEELRWLATDGVPWLARRLRDLGPVLARTALQNLLPGAAPCAAQGRIPTRADQVTLMSQQPACSPTPKAEQHLQHGSRDTDETAALAAWWRQGFEALMPQRTPSPSRPLPGNSSSAA